MKKKLICHYGNGRGVIKLLIIMKLTLLLFLVPLMSLSASSYSQQSDISIDFQKAQLKEVLNEIENQSNFRFVYRDNLVKNRVSYDVRFNKENINKILEEIFSDTDIEYNILQDNLVVLVQKDLLEKQGITIKGTITDINGMPLPGVNVLEKGTTNGAVTNLDGVYTITVSSPNAILIFSFVGYLTEETQLDGQTSLNITLIEDIMSLEEVVVIGYGSMKKSDLTGSLASVSSDEINAFPATTVSQALQGRASGVHIIQNTGQPGAAMQIRIRGTNSIKGDNSPLWIIDGFPGDQSMLNMADIERIEVLKDASATAIYGSRGANGVIIVSTKKGKAGKTRVEYDGSYSLQNVRKKLDLMNATEYMELVNLQQFNDEGAEYFTNSDINSIGDGYDWQDLMFRTAPVQDHTLTVSGGNETSQFSIGSSYYDQKGILLNDDGYRRISLRANVNHDISKMFSVSYNVIASRTNQDTKYSLTGPWTAINAIIMAPPVLGPYEEDDSYKNLKTQFPFSYDGTTNPVEYANEISNKTYNNKFMGNLAFTFKPIEGLSIKISGNANNADYRTDNYTPTTYTGSSGWASITNSESLHINSDNIITYQHSFNDIHDITVTGAMTYEESQYTSSYLAGSGFLSDITETYNIGSASSISTPSSSYSKWNLLSYLGRINYSFKGRYMATVSFRADGSSRYSEGNKWGYFPSAALAWRVSDEAFMENVDLISNLKIRGGYGETGSTAISAYATQSLLSTGKTVFNNDLYTFFAPSTSLPGDLKWETTAQTDIGIDLGILNNRLGLSIDYYSKHTRDLLNNVQLPRSSGYTSTIKNIGEMQNKGVDLQLDANIIDSELKWDIAANISFNRNEVIKLYEGQDITGSSYNLVILGDYVNLVREGEPLGVFYGYQEDGYDENGLIQYKDNDGVDGISAADKTIIGDPNPDFIYGFNSTLTFKNFEFSLYIQGSQGNDIMSLSTAYQNYYGVGINTLKEVYDDHWTESNTDAKYAKVSSSTTSLKMSDRFVYDGSYIRLKNIQLGYNLPFKKMGIPWIERGQIYVSGQNLITITDYPWWDPEVNSSGGGSSLNQGIDYFTYPTLKGLTYGLKLVF